GKSTGTNDNNSGLPGLFTNPVDISTNGLDYTIGSYRDAALFGSDYWAPSTIERSMLGVKFTHVLNSATFYDVGFHWFKTRYNTNPGQIRDTSNVFRFGNSYLVNEAPFGFPSPFTPVISGIGSRMNMDLGWS